jgi:hypothetical protein
MSPRTCAPESPTPWAPATRATRNPAAAPPYGLLAEMKSQVSARGGRARSLLKLHSRRSARRASCVSSGSNSALLTTTPCAVGGNHTICSIPQPPRAPRARHVLPADRAPYVGQFHDGVWYTVESADHHRVLSTGHAIGLRKRFGFALLCERRPARQLGLYLSTRRLSSDETED